MTSTRPLHAWIISPRDRYDSHRQFIRHDQENSKSTYFSLIRGSCCYVIQAVQHLHSPGLHAQLCMNKPVSIVLSL